MSHTPCPWKATLRKLRHSVTGPQGQYIADLMWRGNDKKEEQSADARLIATAPEMLDSLDPDTLEAIANEIDCFEHSARTAGLRLIAKKQRAAIAKATGEPKHGSDTEKVQP